MSKEKLIIFDLDGVLVDSIELASNHTISQYPTVTKEMVNEMLAGNIHEELVKMKLVHIPIPLTDEEKKIRSDAYTASKFELPLYDGIEELLKNLCKKHILVINTSALDKNCLPLLEKLDILKYFDFVATAAISKSKVEKFRLIEEKYNIPKENVLFITDTLGDIREAKEAGVYTIAVTWGAHDRGYFTREKNDNLIAIVDSVNELEMAIEQR